MPKMKRLLSLIVVMTIVMTIFATITTNAAVQNFTLSSPVESQSYSGIVSINGTFIDDTGLSTIEYKIDGAVIGTGGYTSLTGEFRSRFHTAYFSAGWHVFTVTATSGEGLQYSIIRNIYIN